jgi:hypothetical protein
MKETPREIIEEILAILVFLYFVPATYGLIIEGLTKIEWMIYIFCILFGFYITYRTHSLTEPEHLL